MNDDVATVVCPYCWQVVEVVVDPGGGRDQSYIEDCEICCRPWQVRVHLSPDQPPQVDVRRLDD